MNAEMKKRPAGNLIISISVFFLVAVLISLMQFIQLNYSCLVFGLNVFVVQPYSIVANLTVLLLIAAVFSCFVKEWYISFIVTSCLSTIWSLINYYVSLFHGSPLFVSEILNFKTAVNVISGYEFRISGGIIGILLLGLLEIACALIIKKITRNKAFFNYKLVFTSLIVSIVLVYVFVFSEIAAKPQTAIGWSLNDALKKYGYILCSIEDIQKTIQPLKKPDGYSEDLLPSVDIAADQDISNDEYPDIILILNETLYDLNQYINTNTDLDYMKEFHEIDNTITGKCVIPSIGGGTNNTEYELLSSNSMYLLKNAAPFNYVNLSDSEASIAKYLNKLGYQTMAMHSAEPENYNRGNGYRDIGFDQSKFVSDYVNLENYGNRFGTDSSSYRNLLLQYESMTDDPRFIYMLTYQNHGGYEQNDDDFDLVHTKSDFGDLTDDINEYLTGIKMSCEAFTELTDYYKNCDRKVIVCMVGDHAPAFISELDRYSLFNDPDSADIAKRAVPYIIWSNYLDLKNEKAGYCSSTDLVPMTLELGNLPLSYYYSKILDIHNTLPARTSYGKYVIDEETYGDIQNSEFNEMMQDYYLLEYYSLTGKDQRTKAVFEPYYSEK